MTAQLRLQKRDDPLAINQGADGNDNAPADGQASGRNRQGGGEGRRRATRRATPAKASAAGSKPARRRGPASASKPTPSERTYDEDRLEQTGWRLYESLLAEVRTRAEELSAAGIPTSAAALAAATLHSHLPHNVEEGTELMLAYRRASAGRRRARSG